jgi:hypothetical protein
MMEKQVKEKPYREGDDETLDESVQAVPITAFLAVMLPNGAVDVVTTLPGFQVQREVTAQDIRNMSRSIADDAQVRLVAAKAAGGMARSLTNLVTAMSGKQSGPPGMGIPGMPPGMVPPDFFNPNMVPSPAPVRPVAMTPDLSKAMPKGKGKDEG